MDLAHLVPRGNESTRFAFGQALARRGHTEAARRQRDLVLQIGRDDLWESNEALRQKAYEQMASKDYLKAADTFERFRLRCLRAGTSFVDYRAYLYVPALVHQNRARGLVAAGKFDEAKEEFQLGLRLVPGHLEMTILMAGDLEKAGRKAEADEVFRMAFALHEKLCSDFPRSPSVLNSAAWLSAGCRREMDKGLTFAARAVELAPEQASLLDTQAELHFQRGDKDKALELMQRCLKLEPRNEYYRKQLKRIEAGDPKAELPDGGL
jgi:tetratricopeptide (TPR) repeat protein